MDISKFASEIQKTGFVLENQVAHALKSNGWTVISNKYYVDDSEENVREIDLIAYRTSKIQHINLYTVLVIGCKKSDSNVWALLARDINLADPNSDWSPLHAWTNDKAIQYQLSLNGTAKRYHDEINALSTTKALSIPDVEVFAFQEMDKKSGKPQNDKPIFSTITSLMKAQAYEISSLPLRKKEPSIYQFNLISVVESDLVRIKFKDQDVTCSTVEAEHYISRYIIKKRETFSRIRFVKASAFKKILGDYRILHTQNCKWFDSSCNEFYTDALKDWRRVDVFIEDFKKAIGWYISSRVENKFQRLIDTKEMSLSMDTNTGEATISLNTSQEIANYLNGENKIKPIIADALKKYYRYEGSFKFDDNYLPW